MNLYTCSFCGKQAEGKPLSYLYPSAAYDHNGNVKVKLIRSEYSKYGPIVDMKLVKVKL